MKTFTMYRRNREAVLAMHRTDTASVPADHPTLEGVVFSDGKVAVRWLTPHRSTVVWDSFGAFEAIHVSNHPDYATEIVWDTGPSQLEISQTEAYEAYEKAVREDAEARGTVVHCDALVLHPPGECGWCDERPNLRAERERLGIAFTGRPTTGMFRCPAEQRRSVETIHRWPGNQPDPTAP